MGTFGVSLFQHIRWADALLLGLFPFILTEPGKVLLAASLTKLGYEVQWRWIASHSSDQS
jgi:biotin transporter BioY